MCKKYGDKYCYVVVRIDKDGQFCKNGDVLDVKVYVSSLNESVCVCEDDFKPNRVCVDDEWNSQIANLPMQKYSTSSSISVFN